MAIVAITIVIESIITDIGPIYLCYLGICWSMLEVIYSSIINNYATTLALEHRCEVPDFIENGFLEMSNRRVNGTVTYLCADGYRYTRTKTRVCQPNLTWSGESGVCKGRLYQ